MITHSYEFVKGNFGAGEKKTGLAIPREILYTTFVSFEKEGERVKLIHLSDLHIGKRVHECSMLDEQRYILTQILHIVAQEQPDGVLIAGDVYDKPVPPAEAVQVFDDFLVRLAAQTPAVFLISGNHDSAERLAFGARLMAQSGVHVAPVYDGTPAVFTLRDAFGEVDLFLLPFIKPAQVRPHFPDRPIDSYTDALRCVIDALPRRTGVRQVLVTHQFVTGATRCESEEISVGGSDNVDAAVFDGFDYVALGHLHGAQHVGRNTVRYSGSPLKYSFSEVHQQKSLTVVELDADRTTVRTCPLTPQHDLCELRGSYMELTSRAFYSTRDTDAYYHITLTDEQDIPEAMGRLRTIYPRVLRLDYDNTRTRAAAVPMEAAAMENRSPLDLFDALYERQNGQAMSDTQRAFLTGLIEEIWEANT